MSFNPTLVQFKPRRPTSLSRRAPSFQSYLSPIQTATRRSRPSSTSTTFNPTLVQFKRGSPSPMQSGPDAFQSYLSPIQTRRSTAPPRPHTIFQSYLSPIQTRYDGQAQRSRVCFQSYLSPIQTPCRERFGFFFHPPFNPTLVQFKPHYKFRLRHYRRLSILP